MNSTIKKFRADLPAWILICGFGNFPWLIVWINSSDHGFHLGDWLFAISASGLSFAFMASYQIRITPTELIFRSLFRGKQSVKHEEIKKISLEWKFLRQGLRSQPPLQLVVKRRDSKKDMKINAKVFSGVAVDAVLDLGKRVAKADDGGLRDGIVMKTLRGRKQK